VQFKNTMTGTGVFITFYPKTCPFSRIFQ